MGKKPIIYWKWNRDIIKLQTRLGLDILLLTQKFAENIVLYLMSYSGTYHECLVYNQREEGMEYTVCDQCREGMEFAIYDQYENFCSALCDTSVESALNAQCMISVESVCSVMCT